MMRRLILMLTALMCIAMAYAQPKKVYNETIDPMQQIDEAVELAAASNRNVICQVGGNWCRWCLKLADFIENDEELKQLVDDNYVYIHVNYPRTGTPDALLQRLGNPGRFGYPVLVVLDPQGKVIHIQDTVLLEQGDGYDREKLMRFLTLWHEK